MRVYASGIFAMAMLWCWPALGQAPAPNSEAAVAAVRAAQGYAPVRIWDHGDVRATRVELNPMATRATHQHDDVKFHLFIPLAGKLQLTVGSDKPVDAPVGQAFYIKGGTPHGFRNLAATPGAAMEIFVTDHASTASLGALDALIAALQTNRKAAQ